MKKNISFLKIFINFIIIIMFISLFILGIYFLKEFVLKEEVAEIFKESYDEVIYTKKEIENGNVKNPSSSIQTSYNNSDINSNNFYYNQLDAYAKNIYNKLEENKENIKIGTYTLDFGKSFNELLNSENGEEKINTSYQSALDAYLLDNPDIFYIDVTKMYLLINSKTVFNKTTYTVSIGGENGSSYLNESFYSEEQVRSAISQVEKNSDNILNNLSGSQYQKAKELHDWLVDNLSYDQTLRRENIRNIYGALEENVVVCEGYAKAYKYLLDKAGIENIIVVGYGTNSIGQTEEHAWNYVKINNCWYAVDTTWDDPIIEGGGKLTNKNKYKYFLKGSYNFNETHEVTGKTSQGGIIFTYPELNMSDYE